MSKYPAALKDRDFHEPTQTALQELQKDLNAVNAVTELQPSRNIEAVAPASNAGASRPATPAEAAELRKLIECVVSDAPDEWSWIHQTACADVEAALECFRALAADRGLPELNEHDAT